MKTSYYLIGAAVLAAAGVALYPKSAKPPQEPPALPVPADPPAPPTHDFTAEPPIAAPVATVANLPPIPTPPDAPLVIPAAASLPPIPTPNVDVAVTTGPLPVPPPDITPPALPAIPPVGTPPAVPSPEPPALPTLPPTPASPPSTPSAPALPGAPPPPSLPVVPPGQGVPPVAPPVVPELPTLPPTRPSLSPVPPAPTTTPPIPTPPPALPQPAPVPAPAKPAAALPPPTPVTPLTATDNQPAANLAASGKFAVLKGHKLVEGAVTVAANQVIVRQGSLDRPFPKGEVLFIAETRDDVYRFMLGRVTATDPVGRLAVARWCMFSGLREQALVETREVLKLQPGNATAADMARSLEASLKQFPADGSAPVVAAKPAAVPTEPEPDVTPEAAASFVARAQPVLANLCVECHARADHPGALKLTRVTGYEAGPQTTKANLRAVAGQLKKDDPLNSPLLTKALAAHGTMKQPAFANRQVPGYKALEAWVLQAVGTPVPPMDPPAQPVVPMPTAVVPPPIPAPPVLPPVESTPAVPPSAAPVPVPPVLPTPPSIPPAAPSNSPGIPPIPVIPPAEVDPKVPTVPPIPMIPPAASALPKPPGGVQPAGGAGGDSPPAPRPGSQFGTSAPPKPPATQPNTKGDEFDPDAFNKAGK